MAGHSKWAQIKRKKAVTDAKRGKMFTRLLREITVATRMGGGDPDGNPRLRTAIQDAKSNNVPNDNIDRAIKKGLGELGGDAIEEVLYEGYGPYGVAVMVETVTDNRNRTVGELRHVFSKHGGNLGENGCVGWMFDKRGYFLLPLEAMGEEKLMEVALELGVEDISTTDDGHELYTAPNDYLGIKQALAEREIPIEIGELTMIPQNYAEVEADKDPELQRFLEALEDLDDVQNAWSNYDAPEDVGASEEDA